MSIGEKNKEIKKKEWDKLNEHKLRGGLYFVVCVCVVSTVESHKIW